MNKEIKEFRKRFGNIEPLTKLLEGTTLHKMFVDLSKKHNEDIEQFILTSLYSQKSSIIEELKEICDKTENEGGRLLLEEFLKAKLKTLTK